MKNALNACVVAMVTLLVAGCSGSGSGTGGGAGGGSGGSVGGGSGGGDGGGSGSGGGGSGGGGVGGGVGGGSGGGTAGGAGGGGSPAGPPSKIVLSASQTTMAGQCSAAVTVEAQDSSGKPTNDPAGLTVTLFGPATGFTFFSDSACTAGVANLLRIEAGTTATTFYFIGTLAGPQPITATSAPLGSSTRTHTITAGAPSVLAFSSAPQTQTAGMCAKFDLEVRDAFTNPVPLTAGVTVTLTSVPAMTFSDAAGCAAAVTSVSLTGAGVSFYGKGTTAGIIDITATAPFGTPAAQAFTVTSSAAALLSFQVQPSNATGGITIAPAIEVAIKDAAGNPTASTANVTIAIGTNPGAGVLSGTLTVAAVAGVATFTNLSISAAGVGYTLVASSAALTGATSTAFNVIAGGAQGLAFLVQPTDATAGVALAPAVKVRVLDALGNLLTSSTANITLALGTNPGAGALAGTLTVAAVAGVATFNGVSINKSGVGYTLAATSGALTAPVSTAFTILPAAPSALAFSVQPTNAAAGAAIAPAIQVTLRDSFGNTTSGATDNVTLAIGTNPATGILSGTKTVAAVMKGMPPPRSRPVTRIVFKVSLPKASGRL